MKYWISHKKGVMRLVAMILAVSLVFSNEMVTFDVVSASYIDSSRSGMEDTADSQDSIQNNSDNGQTETDAPSTPDDPDDSDYSGNSDDPNQIEVSSNPVDSENPEAPEDKEDIENPADPESPENPENPDDPENKEDLENSEGLENPDAPEDKEDLENSEGLENPDDPEDKEDLENPADTADPESPENPENPENPDAPEDKEDLENSEGFENPDDPEDKEDIENSEGLENSDAPEDKEDIENSEGLENSDAPEDKEDIENPVDPESPENPENSENSENPADSEDSGAAAFAEEDYGEASQSGSCGSNLTWTYYADTKTLVISGTGEMDNYLSSNQWKDITDIEHLVIEEGVTSIGGSAFAGKTGLVGEIHLPQSLTTIGGNAFNGCSGITKVVFADGDGESRTLVFGGRAFEGCSSLKTIRFPQELKELTAGSNTYLACNNLTELTIPGGLGTITQAMGFQHMEALTKITVEDGITVIDGGALPTDNLEEIRLPDSLEEINRLFNGAYGLARVNPTDECGVNLPAGIKKIGDNAFYGCTSLTGEVRFPASVKTIGANAFSGCSGITKMVFADGDGESRTLEFGIRAFDGCSELATIRFPKELTELTAGGYTYSNCNKLTELTIPGSLGHVVTSMGFQHMNALTKITVEDGITAIEKNALYTIKLEEIRLPDSLEMISDSLFSGAANLARINPTEECDVNLPAGIGSIGKDAFRGCKKLDGEVRLPVSVTTVDNYAFYECSGIKKVVFADGDGESRTLKFGIYVFYNCSSLETIRFPQELKELTAGSNTYSYCSNLTELTIPGSLGEIKSDMGFQQMNALTKITVEDGITAIDAGALPKNYLEEIRLPDSLKEISNNLFLSARNLVRINPTEECNINLPAGIGKIGDSAFNGCAALAGEVRLPVGVETVGNSAFNGCSGITKVVFADGDGESRTIEFGNYAFNNCGSLETIRFPQELTGLTVTGGGTYSGCNKLTELTIPGSLREIKSDMGFQRMTVLKNITVEDGITAIDAGALPKGNLEEIRLPDSLKEISDNLFLSARNLVRINPTEECNINLPAGIGKIGDSAFNGCASLAGEVRIPVGVTTVGQSAFSGCSGITMVVFADGDGESRTLEFGNYAFNGCSSLETIRFPQELTGLTVTGGGTYSGCNKLTELTIPGSLREIKSDMGFQRMTVLKKITVEDGITAIDGGALPKNYLEEIRLPDSLKEISDNLFSSATKLVRINPTEECGINLPEGIGKIGESAFSSCYALAGEVRIPVGVTTVGKSAFSGCSGITKVVFADGDGESRTIEFGDSAFNGCDILETIRFPQELTELTATGGWTYSGCNKLTELTIPGSLKHIIKDMGFQRMAALKKITVEDGITAIDTGALPTGNLEEIRLPDDLEEIPDSLFSGAANLARINPTEECGVNLPTGLRRIGNNAFYGCTALSGELRIPAGVSEIGQYAFRECVGFTELYLPDVLCTLGNYAFDYCYGLTAVHTGLMPVYRSNGTSIFQNAPIQEVWFRGPDGGTVAEMDGIGNADWSMLMRYSQLYQTSTLYIDDTVNRLTDQAFWGNYSDVRFVGPNVVTLEKTNGGNIFSAMPTPLRELEGVYYATQEGALYALNPASGTAALAYCPPGITELYIPSTITATEDITADSQYAGNYRVTGVTQHAVMAATDLVSVTAANPQQIVLSTHAFADCPTLSSINGVTTRKEAGALFGPNGTPAIKKAFGNTGLEEGDEESSGRGKPMRSLTYINPNVGKLTVNIRRTSGTLEYSDDAYRLLTGEGVAFDLKAEAYGASTVYAPFRLYFEPSDPAFTGMKTGTQTYRITSNGTTHFVSVKTVYDSVSGCYCVSFNLPAGVTWEWKGIADTDGETVMYPLETRGGELCVWGEVLDFTDAESGGEEDDEVFGGFSDDNNYMLTAWDTKRNHYELKLTGNDNKAKIDSKTHRPAFSSQHGGLAISAIFRDGIRDNTTNKGKDPVTAIRYHYTITLPEGMTWAEEEAILQNVGSTARVENMISVSADRRELVYEFEQPIANRNDIIGVTYQRLWLGFSGSPTSSIQVGGAYDFYRDLGQKIEYKCRATIYYQFSEPDETQEVTAYENLKPTDEGVVELKRQYEFPEPQRQRGRGLPMEISFVAENKSEDPSRVNLFAITEEVLNESNQNNKHNGYLYLTEGQMADVILGESRYLEIQNIEITQAALYRDRAYKSEISHLGTDGSSVVWENLLNTYAEPTEKNARIVLTVSWPDSESGEAGGGTGETQGRRPVGLSISVNGGAPQEIPFSADREELAQNIKEALEEAGYLIPTGLYRLTWNATDAARNRIVGPYTDMEGKSYHWVIGSYQATVKPDYLQGHRFLTSDSLGNYRYLFTDDYRQPTAQAVFTLQDGSGGNYQTTDSVRDISYEVSQLKLHATGIDSKTGEEILTENSGEQWLCPGVVLSWRVDFNNGNYSEFRDIPFMQTLDRYQCLLAPVVSNPALADQGYETITFRDKEYYMLKPAEGEQQIQGLWLDGGDAGGNFYADSVTVAGGEGTQIRWYEESVGPRLGGDDTREYRFLTYVLAPESSEERPTAASVVYANNYKSSEFSTRIYNYFNIGYQRESIHKDIITNPEAVGTEEEKTAGDQRTSYLGAGTSVTYRLSFDEYWIGDYTLGAGEIYDMLPCTYGLFEWKLNENVQVKYALRERVAKDGQTAVYEPYLPEDGANFARIDLVEEPINGTGNKVEQYRLSFGEFTIPYNRTLYIYVTLTFPEEQAVWDSFAEVADEYLYNIFCFQDLRSSVLHMVARPTQAFLKTGMYGTEGDPYGFVYSNSDEKDRIIKYYLILYNHGKSFLYLNPVHIKIPEGFTLKAPPKVYMNTGLPNWNLTDVSVLDEDPPAKISRMNVWNVEVTYAEEDEAVLDIVLEAPWYTYAFDELVGKYFLRPGQYVAVELRMEVGGYQETPDAISLPAVMPIDDSFHVGRIAQVQGVDAHRSGYGNSNEGIPEFWESDEIAAGRGFRDPSPSDTGKWVASETRLIREEAKPGVTKGAPVLKRVAQGETPYDPQEGAAMEHPVKWETRLVNGGTNSLTDFRVKDSVQWPYVFEGEVKLTSQISAAYDKKFTISRYTSQIISEGGDMVEQIDRDKLKIGEQEVRIADSRQEAFEEDSGCSATVFRNVKVYFYKEEDVFGDGHPAETMEFDFTQDRDYGIGPASYSNGRVVENSRILSYWTKFDLSRKNEATRSSYANRMILEPEQPYTKADVSQGIAIDGNGEPVQNEEETPAGIMAMGYVSVNAGQSTAAWMKVKENKKAGEEDQEPEITDDIREMLTRENKIIQGDVENTVTYTLNVLNHVANPNDTVVSADDRKYSIQNMVIINTLPYLGDKMPFNSKVPRSSDFGMIPDRDSFNLTLYYYNAEEDAGQETDIPEDKLHPLPEDCYQILYNENTDVAPRDWLFNENSAPGWNTEIPDDLSEDGWKTADEFGDITKARSFRIEIKDPNKVFDSANPSVYRSLMSAGCTVVVKYQARVQTGLTENGTQTPTPGQCAWNSFGYRFERFDGGTPMEASSIRTGVQIPSIPILYEKLIDYDQNPYVNQGEPQKFTFTIDKEAGQKEDGTTRPAQQLKFTVTVGTGQSENNRELLNIRNLEPEVVWWKEAADDDSFFWEDGASYIVKQTGAPAELPRFSIKVNGQQTTEFVYDALYEPVIVVTNQSKVWSSQLFKMDSESRGWDPTDDKDREQINFLSGALFGLYTTDKAQQIDIAAIREEAGSRYEWWQSYQSILQKMMEVVYGDNPDTAVKLYLKDFCVTDANGEIHWQGLEDDKYYVRELDPPEGFRLSETFYPISRRDGILSVYNDPGLRLPVTGGGGTLPFYIGGVLILLANTLLAGRRRRRKRKIRKE